MKKEIVTSMGHIEVGEGGRVFVAVFGEWVTVEKVTVIRFLGQDFLADDGKRYQIQNITGLAK